MLLYGTVPTIPHTTTMTRRLLVLAAVDDPGGAETTLGEMGAAASAHSERFHTGEYVRQLERLIAP